MVELAEFLERVGVFEGQAAEVGEALGTANLTEILQLVDERRDLEDLDGALDKAGLKKFKRLWVNKLFKALMGKKLELHGGYEPSRKMLPESEQVKWDSIGGLEQAKRELQEMILYPIEYPKKLEMFDLQASRGVVLYGPPGCGKTMLAKAVATECSANFVSIKMSRFSQSEENLREVFDKARSAAPCVLLVDEVDQCTEGAMKQLLTEIDTKKIHFLICATNRPELLDEDLLQPGRLDQLIYIPLPDLPARQGILESVLRRCPIAPNVAMGFLAQETEGYTGADLAEFGRVAAKAAIRDVIAAEERKGDDVDVCNQIGRKHFEEAFVRVRRSVAMNDLAKFDQFARKFDPRLMQRQGERRAMLWPQPDDALDGGMTQDDDLYA